jgi:oxaloacetate decarboxylase gamma subunit
MEEVNLIAESIKFMFLGMGVVFAFLAIMIFVLKAQGKILTKFFPQEEKKAVNVNPVGNSSVKTNNESVLGYFITLSDTLQRSSTDVSKNGKILVFLLSSCKHKKLPVLLIFTFLLVLSCSTTLPPAKVFLKSDFMMSEIF